MARFGAFVAAAVLAGCVRSSGTDPGFSAPGDLELTWRIGTSSCAEQELETVAVLLDGIEVATFPCEPGGGVVERLDARSYDLALMASDRRGADRYGAELGTIAVQSGVASSVPTALLSALPASVMVTWYFENGRLCDTNGVESVDLTLFDDGYLLLTETADCSGGAHDLVGIEAGSFEVNAMGRDSAGVALFNGVADVVVDMGDLAVVEVMLSDL